MKFGFLLALLFLAFLPASHAALQQWNVDISLNDDRTSDWIVTYQYSENIQNSDFFLLAGISSYNVTADDAGVTCTALRGIGTSIECRNINATTIVYRFRTFPVITSLQNLNIFSQRISMTQVTGKFSAIIRLPIGTALADTGKLNGTGLNPTEPMGAEQGSDGRRIFVQWNLQNPKLGNTYDFTTVYETARQTDFNMPFAVIAIVVIAFLIVLVFFFRRGNIQDILPVLTDNERKVMEIVLRDKNVDQRKIVKETDFSKPKVSRIIRDLGNRGIIEKRLKGRTNIISLKKSKKTGKTADSEKPKYKVD